MPCSAESEVPELPSATSIQLPPRVPAAHGWAHHSYPDLAWQALHCEGQVPGNPSFKKNMRATLYM